MLSVRHELQLFDNVIYSHETDLSSRNTEANIEPKSRRTCGVQSPQLVPTWLRRIQYILNIYFL